MLMQRAISVAPLLAHDHHEGRAQHRARLLAYIYAFTGSMHEAASELDAVTHATRPGWRTSVPSTGWHIATALCELENGHPKRGLDTIDLVSRRLDRLEHWPFIVWTRARLQLAAGEPQIAFDEFSAAVKQNEFRPLSDYARSLLHSMKANLQLALGRRNDAGLEVRRMTDLHGCAPMLVPERLALTSGTASPAPIAGEIEFIHEHGTSREFAEALLVSAASDVNRGHEADAERSLRKAAHIMSRQGLTSPLGMIPHSALRALAARQAPELAAIFETTADPFSRIALINPLQSPRTRSSHNALERSQPR